MQNIQKLNDQLRKTFQGGNICITAAVQQLDTELFFQLLEKLKNYDDFTEDNDPYGEHDFGIIKLEQYTFYWKIDYYARDMMHRSENPADPSKTIRVLTIMFAEEY